ncbi:MAG: hypothetical protein ACE361_24775 [Aureliella sp.]
MKPNTTTKLVSWLSLALVIIPSLISFTGAIDLRAVQWCAIIGTIGWFLATPIWMSREPEVDDAEVQI